MTTLPIAVPETGEHVPIRTFADILHALSQDPALAEALRQHVLDDELRRLPAAFQRLAATVEEFMTQTNRILAELRAGQARHDADIAEVKAGQARHDADIAEIKADIAEVKAGQARHDADIAEIKADMAEVKAGQARHDADIAEVKADINELKAKFLPLDARKMIGVIAARLNIRRPAWLDGIALLAIADDAGDLADAVPDNELQSFCAIDVALRAVGKVEGDTQYVVIECSNTVDRNDILRIRRNADLMTRFTGHRTHAMVIGNRLPERIAAEADAHGVLALQPGVRVTRAT